MKQDNKEILYGYMKIAYIADGKKLGFDEYLGIIKGEYLYYNLAFDIAKISLDTKNIISSEFFDNEEDFLNEYEGIDGFSKGDLKCLQSELL